MAPRTPRKTGKIDLFALLKENGQSSQLGSDTWAIKQLRRRLAAPTGKKLVVHVVLKAGRERPEWFRLKDMSQAALETLKEADANGAAPITKVDQVEARRMMRVALSRDCALLARIYSSWRRHGKKKTFNPFDGLSRLPAGILRSLKRRWSGPVRTSTSGPWDEVYAEDFIHDVLQAEGLYPSLPSPENIKRYYIPRKGESPFVKKLPPMTSSQGPLERQVRKAMREGRVGDIKVLMKRYAEMVGREKE